MNFTQIPLGGSPRKGWKKQWNPRSFVWFISFFLLLSLILYHSIHSVGSIIIWAWTYTLDKWVTVYALPKSLDITISPWKYKLWVKYFAPKIENLQAWGYRVENNTSLESVFSTILTKPIFTDLTITILPGWNSYDIDDYLYRKDIIENPGDFLLALQENFIEYQKEYPFLQGVKSIEWFLYPDTYRIPKNANADIVARKLLSTFWSRIGDTYSGLWENAYTDLILASIVEREERISSEKPIVAGILSKRVSEWIPMGADATVCFGYEKTQKTCTPDFIGSVIAIKHPYNTRNKQWYPPTPIANMSLDTWSAVLSKKSSPYYYYLHDSGWSIHYAKTLAEHNENKYKYIR